MRSASRALAKGEVQRVDDDGLARAGLTREHAEPGRELHPELVDDREVFDVQFF
jgi:hypothetical protein